MKCSECGGVEIRRTITVRPLPTVTSGPPYRLNELEVVRVTSCLECSETIQIERLPSE